MSRDSGNEWVVLATLTWLQEAIVLRAMLEGAGVETQIPEEHIASIHPITTVMQVRVLVRAKDLLSARELVEQPPSVAPAEEREAEELCAACGSREVRRQGNRVLNFLMIPIALLFAVPVRWSGKKVCASCGRSGAKGAV